MTQRLAAGVLLAALVLLGAQSARADELPAGGAGNESAGAPARRSLPADFALPAEVAGGRLWSDGEDLLIVQHGPLLYEIERGSEPVSHALPGFISEESTHIVGVGRGAQAVVAVWGQRFVAVRRSGEWAVSELPSPGRDCLGATDLAGRFYCAREAGSLAVLQGAEWTVFEPSIPNLQLSGIAVGAGGTVYLVDQGARVVAFSNGAFRLQRFGGLSKGVQRASWSGAHYSPDSGLLWVGTSRESLLSLNLATGKGREHSMPSRQDDGDESAVSREAPQMARLRGGRAGGRDVLWVPGQGHLYLYDGRQFLQTVLARYVVERYIYDVTVCLRDATAYATTDKGLARVAVEAEVLGSGAGLTMGRDDRRILPLPVLRLGLGPVWGLTSDGAQGPALALDTTVGAMLMWSRGKVSDWAPLLLPEVGWSWNNDALRGGHLFIAGLGAGYGSAVFGLTYMPRLVAGSIGGQSTVGLRHGLTLHFLLDLLSVEVSHQVLSASALQQDLRLMVNLNALPMLFGLAGLAVIKGFAAGLAAVFQPR